MERERGRGRRRREEEEGEIKQTKVWNFGFLVWKLNLCMDSMRLCMNFHTLMVNLLPKSRVLIELHLNLGFLKIGLIKPHMVPDKQRIISFRMDSWLIESL